MARYLISFGYDGKDFFGSQTQPDKRTVQGTLDKAICTLIKKDTKIIMAGRLDRGVSALCHTAHFDADEISDEFKFLSSLNSILEDDISVFKIQKVESTFHAQKSATFRHYRYTIRNSFVKPVFNKRMLYIRKPLNFELMDKTISKLEGKNDFSAFKSTSDTPKPVNPVCEIYFAGVEKREIDDDVRDETDGCYLDIDIVGSRFLYNMVRAITGTVLMLEKDKANPERITEIMNSKQRALAGCNVSPCGLTLIKTGYSDPYDYVNTQLKNKRKGK